MLPDEPPSRLRSRRRLTEDEIELWLQVARTIDKRSDVHLPEKSALTPQAAKALPELPAKLRQATAASYSPPLSQAKKHELPLAPLERRLKKQLLRGQSSVDQVLDLHGLHQGDAHHRLKQFIMRAQLDGARVVLVITGKGRSTPGEVLGSFEVGILRRMVPHWLRGADMRSLVIGFEEAGVSLGGSGALLVRVRKRDRTW